MGKYCSRLVIAFEPSPHIFRRLKKNIEFNKLQEKIFPFNYGLSDKEETLSYFETRLPLGNAHLANSKVDLHMVNPNHLIDEHIKVKCFALDDLRFDDKFGLTNGIDLIKVDIETMEYKFIRGARKLIQSNAPAIICETQRDASYVQGKDVTSEIFEFLYGLGYRSFRFQDSKFIEFIYPEFGIDTYFLPERFLSKLSELTISIGQRGTFGVGYQL
jgi:FkbM family methyltransferase